MRTPDAKKDGIGRVCRIDRGRDRRLPDFRLPDFRLPDFRLPDFRLPGYRVRALRYSLTLRCGHRMPQDPQAGTVGAFAAYPRSAAHQSESIESTRAKRHIAPSAAA